MNPPGPLGFQPLISKPYHAHRRPAAGGKTPGRRREERRSAVSARKSAGWRKAPKTPGTPRKPISRQGGSKLAKKQRSQDIPRAVFFLHDDRALLRGGRSGRNGRSGSRGRGHHNSGTDKQGRSRRSGLGNAAASGGWPNHGPMISLCLNPQLQPRIIQLPVSSHLPPPEPLFIFNLSANEKGLELAKPNASSQSRQPASTGRVTARRET